MQTKKTTPSLVVALTQTTCCSEIATLFDPDLFKALSDPSRIAILASLSMCTGEQSVSQIADRFDLNLSVVSRHLKILKDAQVLNARKEGKEVLYQINVTQLVNVLRQMAEALERCCGDAADACGEK